MSTNTTRIEPLYEVQKREALARRYMRLRAELGADVCLMLALEDAVHEGKEHLLRLGHHGYTTAPNAVTRTLTRIIPSIHNTNTALMLVPPQKEKRRGRKKKVKMGGITNAS